MRQYPSAKPLPSSLCIPLRCTYKLPGTHSKSSSLFHSAMLHSIPCHTCFFPPHPNTQEKRCSSFALGIASCQAITAHFLNQLSFVRSENKLCCPSGGYRQPVMLLASRLSSSRQPTLSAFAASLLSTALRSAQPQRIHRLPVFVLACGSLRAAGCHAFCNNPLVSFAQSIAYTRPMLNRQKFTPAFV